MDKGNNSDYSPISILKVDFCCSQKCPDDVKKILQQLKGVKSVSVDPEAGTIAVVGNVHPDLIIQILKRMGKKAKLHSCDNETPISGKSSPHSRHRDSSSHSCCEGNRSGIESDSDSGDDCEHGSRHGRKGKKSHEHEDKHKHKFGTFHNEHAAPPPSYRSGYHHPPPPPPPGYPPMPGYPHHPPPFPGFHSHHPHMQRFPPMPYAARPPPMFPPPPYGGGYHGRGHPMGPAYGPNGSRLPKFNPMIHYNSYADNFRYTM